MRNAYLIAAIAALTLVGCATIPLPAPVAATAPHSFVVTQFELLMIEYTSPTTVDAVDANGPADKIFSCAQSGVAGVAQAPNFNKHAAYVPTCIPIVFRGPIKGGAVAVQPVAQNVRVLFWAAEALDYDANGRFAKGNQPQGPFPSSAVCATQSQLDIKHAYATGKVASTDPLLIYCVPIPQYGEQADGSGQVDFHITPWKGAGAHCFWEGALSEPCETSVDLEL